MFINLIKIVSITCFNMYGTLNCYQFEYFIQSNQNIFQIESTIEKRKNKQNRSVAFYEPEIKQNEKSRLFFHFWIGLFTLFVILAVTVVWRKINQKKLLDEQLQHAQIMELEAHSSLLKITNNHSLQQAMLISKLIGWLKSLKPIVNKEAQILIQNNLAELQKYSYNNNWNNFEKTFIEIYPGVLDSIREQISGLSVGDLRILCFLIMRLTNSEISMITLQSNSSLRSATFRLRKKFNVSTNDEFRKKLDILTNGKISKIDSTTQNSTKRDNAIYDSTFVTFPKNIS